MKRCVLGIDTSNYTTSVAIVDEDLQLCANIKIPLPVAEGERGLRQSDAVFAHIKNLPHAFDRAEEILRGYQLAAVGVSATPRHQAGSYMPCFLSGVASARGVAVATDVPMYTWSHQCGHIMAVLYGANALDLLNAPFGAFHVSGGTTELVRAYYTPDGFDVTVVGGSRDLHAGQVIDRVGVMLGLRFPAGPSLEELADAYSGKIPHRKPSGDGCYVHLSGLENMASRMYEESADKQKTAAFVFDYVGASLGYMSRSYLDTYGDMPLVYAGGVMSSHILRERLERQFRGCFAPPAFSSDNAVGTAVLTALRVFDKK